MNTALIVIDVQNAVTDDKNFPSDHKARFIGNIATLIQRARASKTPVIYIQHNTARGEFKTGLPSWEIHPEIKPLPNEVVIQKSYCDSFQETALHIELQSTNIEQLIIVGARTEFCVDTTVRRAFSLGYQTILVEDAHGTYNSKLLTADQIIAHHNFVLGRAFAKLKKSYDVMSPPVFRRNESR